MRCARTLHAAVTSGDSSAIFPHLLPLARKGIAGKTRKLNGTRAAPRRSARRRKTRYVALDGARHLS